MANILAEEAVTIFPDDFCAEFKLFNRHRNGVHSKIFKKYQTPFAINFKK